MSAHHPAPAPATGVVRPLLGWLTSAWLIAVGVNFLFGHPITACCYSLFALLAFSLYLFSSNPKSDSTLAARLAILFSYLATFAGAVLEGRQEGGVVWFFFICPCLAAYCLNAAETRFWAYLAILSPLLVALAPLPSEFTPSPDQKTIIQTTLTVLISQFVVLRKKHEEQQTSSLQAHRDQAIQLAESRNRFLATMSHEIRTPLNGVIGLADHLRDTKLSQEQTELLDTLVQSGLLLKNIVDDILDLSSLEAGQLQLRHQPLDIRKISEHCRQVFEPNAQRKGLQFRCDLQIERPYRNGDSLRIQQILNNLISNAIKFTDSGSVRLQVTENANDVTWEVQDTGPGIPADEMERLFEAFQQLKNTADRRQGGTGLGLAIARRLATIHGGTLELVEAKAGATFRLSLPLPVAEKPAHPSIEIRPIKADFLANHHCLVIEDNLVNQKVLVTLLSRWGATTQSVESGNQALALPNLADFQLIFCDLHMPGMDGWETIAALKQQQLPAPILALTADVLEESRQKAIQAGAQAVLHKPIDRQNLAKVLRQLRPKPAP